MAYPERIVPDEEGPGIVAIHLKRYEFARERASGADVLDAACGVGYGTAYLAEVARRVVGVDRDQQAIDYARSRYLRENVEFLEQDVLALDLPDAAFDLVCSFETIEHLTEPDRFVREVARLLRPGGAFLVSTPRVEHTTRRPQNPHHEIEFSQADFEALLRRSFSEVDLYGQRRLQTGRHRLMQRLDVLGLRRRFAFLRRAAPLLGTVPMAEVGAAGITIDRVRLERASELLAVCGGPRRR